MTKKKTVDAFMEICGDNKFITKKGMDEIRAFVEIVYSAGYDNGYNKGTKEMHKEACKVAEGILDTHFKNV